MKPSIDRIQEEIMANTEQCKAEAEGRKNGTPRKQRGSETATAATPEKDADEGKGAVVEEVVDDVVVVPDPTEEVEQPDEAAEPAEQEETPVEETRSKQKITQEKPKILLYDVNPSHFQAKKTNSTSKIASKSDKNSVY